MFGQTGNNQQVATQSTSAQNPSMLDNVAPSDFQETPISGNSGGHPGPPPTDPTTAQQQDSTQQHPVTSDNPFAAAPAASSPAPAPQTQQVTPTTQQQPESSSPSVAPVDEDQTAGAEDTAQQSPQQPVGPVDHEKLAGMKKEAMTHLEPLVDHVAGSPAEIFKTTMMMIQSNDNHTLLDKALDAAKQIPDDKDRAEALMDIITEINYFSQSQAENNQQ